MFTTYVRQIITQLVVAIHSLPNKNKTGNHCFNFEFPSPDDTFWGWCSILKT